MLYSFVILHYKTAEDTIKCVESIKTIDHCCSVKIIIIDNCSNNGSYEELMDIYANDSEVILIHNDKNLGFAGGNNIGYGIAKKMQSDYIAISNNDIVIESKDIILQTIKCYKEHEFAILGPDIISMVDKGHQNPSHKMTTDKRIIKKKIRRYKLLYILNKTPIYDYLKKLFSDESLEKPPKKTTECMINCQLHGSFIIYSKHFIENERYAFCPYTFLYTEEPILYQYCLRKGYQTVYTPDIQVLHKEDSSTNAKYSIEKEKRNFVFANLINSHRVYLDLLENKVDGWED